MTPHLSTPSMFVIPVNERVTTTRIAGTIRAIRSYYANTKQVKLFESYNEHGALISVSYYKVDGTLRWKRWYKYLDGTLEPTEYYNEAGTRVVRTEWHT